MSLKRHIAGIVPVSGIRSDFNMPWHASMMPLAPNYLAVERAVLECAYAGCNTIWVVCGDDVSSLIKHHVGEKIQDPIYSYRHFEHNKNDFKRPIKIYYIPLAIRDINKRDNLAWSAIHGALTAHKVSSGISRWLAPDRFYVAWPYGYYIPSVVRDVRRQLLDSKVAISYEGRTVKDNLYLGVTFDMDDIEQLKKESHTSSSGLWRDPVQRQERLSVEERYSYKHFDLEKVFENLDFENHHTISVEEYFSIDCWEKYCEFLGETKYIKKPATLSYAEWNEIGFDD
mgnify:CR=1 FL=1|tara:strand:+ start:527 stop:1381 length:855 start_codon:yes stop_codon:yes gene_type:complete